MKISNQDAKTNFGESDISFFLPCFRRIPTLTARLTDPEITSPSSRTWASRTGREVPEESDSSCSGFCPGRSTKARLETFLPDSTPRRFRATTEASVTCSSSRTRISCCPTPSTSSVKPPTLLRRLVATSPAWQSCFSNFSSAIKSLFYVRLRWPRNLFLFTTFDTDILIKNLLFSVICTDYSITNVCFQPFVLNKLLSMWWYYVITGNCRDEN